MLLISAVEFTLPLTNPVLKFLIILIIILVAPLLLNKLKIPHILGLIVAGAIIGPHGFNVLLRDSGIILSGTAGLLYILFLAGLEVDLAEFKRNSIKSMVFGLYTFSIPMIFGVLVGIYILQFSIPTSVLLASMFASHTLIAYPILGRFGVTKNRAVNITIGGTMFTDTLALIVLTIVVGMTTGDVTYHYWTRLSLSILAFGFVVLFIFPKIARWFLKRFHDHISQYIFVLSMLFLGAFLAEVAGIEAIIGALLTGFALNRLIPSTSPLMNRIEFVGNAVFIPFFLIGVGMLLDYRAFFSDVETILVAITMTIAVSSAKFIASWLTQKSFRFTADERRLIFGLSNAHAAVTLATVMVGYNVIIGHTVTGEPIRLLGDSILNGTIIMILATCTIATFAAQKGAQNMAIFESGTISEGEKTDQEKILIPISNTETVDELINLSTIIKSKHNNQGFYALNVLNRIPSVDEKNETHAKKILEKASKIAASADIHLYRLMRYDINIVNGILRVIKEFDITDLILGLHGKKGISNSFLGNLTEGILAKTNTSTFIYRTVQPISTIKRHLVIIPKNAESETGFHQSLLKIWNIAKNTGSKLVFYGTGQTIKIIRDIHKANPIPASFKEFEDWNDFLIISREVKVDDNLIIFLSRNNYPSFHRNMANIPSYLDRYFKSNNVILLYPMQSGRTYNENMELNNPSLLEPIEKLDELGKNIAGLFKRK